MNLSEALLIFIQLFVFVFNTLIVARVLMSWFADESNGLFRFLVGITEPVLAPVRKALPSTGGLDLSPLLVVLVLQVVGSMLENLLRGA